MNNEKPKAIHRALHPFASARGILRAFNRRLAKSKLWKPVHVRDGSTLIYVRSHLAIKRQMSQDHILARRYKRAFKGATGRLSWKDFDRLSLQKG